MKLLFITLSLFILLTCTINAEENYCHDPEANQQWEELASKYPQDMGIAALHALRIGLCLKVERGDLSVDEPTDIFEKVRIQLVDKKVRER